VVIREAPIPDQPGSSSCIDERRRGGLSGPLFDIRAGSRLCALGRDFRPFEWLGNLAYGFCSPYIGRLSDIHETFLIFMFIGLLPWLVFFAILWGVKEMRP
jgi:hypothetical protein